jgi:hypothetical protein
MEIEDVQKAMLSAYNLRVEKAMSRYILNRLNASKGKPPGTLPIIGGDARTGVPIRTTVALDKINLSAMDGAQMGHR